MDQFPVEINIDDITDFSLYLTNHAVYYIRAGMVRSFLHGSVSTMQLITWRR